jgi:membrane protease YdiL (CAAX protease family)
MSDFTVCTVMCAIVALFVFAFMSGRSGKDAGLLAVCLVVWSVALFFVVIPYREKFGKHLPREDLIARSTR